MGINKTTYKDYVITYLYEKMQNDKLKPGDQILESHLAESLGISRAPIREALQQLVSEGLLEYKPQVGNFVAALSAKEIIDAYVTRGVLEGFAVAQALDSFYDEDFTALDGLCEKMENYAIRGRQKELIDAGSKFHAMLFNRSDNQQLVEYTERLSHKLHLLFYKHWGALYDAGEIRDRHQSLVKTLRKGNRNDVEHALRQHYLETGQKVARLYEQREQGD